jgi:hypothetical protein
MKVEERAQVAVQVVEQCIPAVAFQVEPELARKMPPAVFYRTSLNLLPRHPIALHRALAQLGDAKLSLTLTLEVSRLDALLPAGARWPTASVVGAPHDPTSYQLKRWPSDERRRNVF